MDIQPLVSSIITTTSTTITKTTTARRRFLSTIQRSAPSLYACSLHRTFCSSRSNSREPKQDGDDSNDEKFSTDWDKAWSKFKKQGKKTLFSPNKYVSWNPRSSNYPLSEEVDPIKRTERSNLTLWTSPRFTLVGAIIIVTFLLVYTILAPIK